ncbi:MAG: hypothetical protein HYZ84_05175 [Candidatus Omnitrophica bacterium]|nr:hypothetical protein [Candidatus Omnitrophota bacterium]
MEIRKLKRGLRDVSPLFGNVEELATLLPPPSHLNVSSRSLEILNVFSANHPEESLFYNTYVASKIAADHFPSNVISLEPFYRPDSIHLRKPQESQPFNTRLKHFSLSWEQFDKIISKPVHPNSFNPLMPQTIFIDFNHSKIPYPEKILAVLNKWILLIRPNLESLTETYKMIKAAKPINPHLEYFIFLDAELPESESSPLFEQFSEVVAKYLGINLIWLGELSFFNPSAASTSVARLDHLFLDSQPPIHSPAKVSLAQFVQPVSDSVVGHAS